MKAGRSIVILLSFVMSVVLIAVGMYFLCVPKYNTDWMIGKDFAAVQARCGEFDFYYQVGDDVRWGAYYTSRKDYNSEAAKYKERNNVTDIGCYNGSIIYVGFTDGVVTIVNSVDDYDPSDNFGL